MPALLERGVDGRIVMNIQDTPGKDDLPLWLERGVDRMILMNIQDTPGKDDLPLWLERGVDGRILMNIQDTPGKDDLPLWLERGVDGRILMNIWYRIHQVKMTCHYDDTLAAVYSSKEEGKGQKGTVNIQDRPGNDDLSNGI
jgi:uncharacterized membrane protein YhdT